MNMAERRSEGMVTASLHLRSRAIRLDGFIPGGGGVCLMGAASLGCSSIRPEYFRLQQNYISSCFQSDPTDSHGSEP